MDWFPGCKPWSNTMEILHEKDGVDTELLVYAMTLINKVSMSVMSLHWMFIYSLSLGFRIKYWIHEYETLIRGTSLTSFLSLISVLTSPTKVKSLNIQSDFSFCRRLQHCLTRIHSTIWWTVWRNRAWKQCPKDTWGGKAPIWTWLSSSTSMRFESQKTTRKILQSLIQDQISAMKCCSHPINMTHAAFIVHLLHTEILYMKHPSPLPLHTQSTFPTDDPTAWRRWRWQPASTSWTPGPPTSQPRGRGQKAWPGEEAEPQSVSWAFRSCLPLQPCVPAESRLPAVQWTKNRGHEWEVRKGGRWKSIITELFVSDHSGDAQLSLRVKFWLSCPNTFCSRALSGFLPSM